MRLAFYVLITGAAVLATDACSKSTSVLSKAIDASPDAVSAKGDAADAPTSWGASGGAGGAGGDATGAGGAAGGGGSGGKIGTDGNGGAGGIASTGGGQTGGVASTGGGGGIGTGGGGGTSGGGSGGIAGTGGGDSGGIASTGGGGSGGIASTGGGQTGGIASTGGTGVGTGGVASTGGTGIGTGGVASTGGTGVTTTGGAGGIATGGASGLAYCPATQPTSGSACAGPYGDSGNCTWGDSSWPECRTRGSCNSGAWILGQPDAYCAAVAAACPSSVPAESSVCTDTSLQCLYGGDLCHCMPCTGMALGDPSPFCLGQPRGTPLWDCTGAYALPAECPATIPNRGAPCSVASTIGCPFDNCGGLNVFCTGGVWTWTYPPVDCLKSWCSSKCSVCASPDTPIATPGGERRIADLQVGDLVYTVEDGAILPVPILRVSRTPVFGYHVVRVQAADSRVLELSPGHPTADGRTFADLRAGTHLDGAAIASVHLVPYRHPYTYDILPMSRSGTYFAAGMLIGTTLK